MNTFLDHLDRQRYEEEAKRDVANILCEYEGRRIMNTKRLSNGNDIAIVAM